MGRGRRAGARHAAETLVWMARLRRRDAWSRERLRRHQEARLRALVDHALARSPFYRERYRAAGVDRATSLARLPIVDKATIMAHFDAVVTDPRLKLADVEAHLARLRGDDLHLGEYRVMATGGTSGVRGVFACDRREWAISVASALRTSAFMGVGTRLGHRLRVASVTAADPVHWGGRYALTSELGLAVGLHLDARTPVSRMVEALNRHRPELLSCYPSIASLLAREQLAGALRIAPRAVATSGEPRSPEVCALMRRAWGDVLFDGYATTETGFCGMECGAHRGVHLLEDLTIFEVVDDDHRPVADGVEGRRLLVTNLFNTTMPLIRYELSDMLTIGEAPCPCGRPWRLATSISGRREDVLRLPARAGGLVDVHPTALTGVIERAAGVRQFRVVHDGARVVVSVVPERSADTERLRSALAAGVRAALDGAGASGHPVAVELVDHIDRRGVAGKLKLVEELGEAHEGS